jgi:putative transposase
MGRAKRAADGGLIYHVLNRANGRMKIFKDEADFEAFERILAEAVERTGTDLLAFCLMPNHWHLVVMPHEDGELSRFVGWLSLTHTQRWHACRRNAGTGHVYQGRFKSFPIQGDEHFLTACRYVERNALRAKLVQRAEDWRWGSLWHWTQRSKAPQALLSSWPIRRSRGWVEHVNDVETEGELNSLRRCVARGNPFGDERWSEKMVKHLGLETTIRPRGRPKSTNNGS